MNEEEKMHLQSIILGSESKIKSSAFFLSIFSESYREQPTPLLQLALAIVLDKPLYLMALPGERVPENLRKVAKMVVQLDDDSPAALEKAAKQLLDRAKVDSELN